MLISHLLTDEHKFSCAPCVSTCKLYNVVQWRYDIKKKFKSPLFRLSAHIMDNFEVILSLRIFLSNYQEPVGA